jgi:hypothetical protein
MSGVTQKLEHSGASWDIPDPGDAASIDATFSGVCALTSAAAETRTLPIPTYIGQWITIILDTDGGDVTLTVTSGYDSGGTTTAIFSTAGQTMEFRGATVGGALRWRLVGNED